MVIFFARENPALPKLQPSFPIMTENSLIYTSPNIIGSILVLLIAGNLDNSPLRLFLPGFYLCVWIVGSIQQIHHRYIGYPRGNTRGSSIFHWISGTDFSSFTSIFMHFFYVVIFRFVEIAVLAK